MFSLLKLLPPVFPSPPVPGGFSGSRQQSRLTETNAFGFVTFYYSKPVTDIDTGGTSK